jgi:hypothetical protein
MNLKSLFITIVSVLSLCVMPINADVDLRWQPHLQISKINQKIELDLYAFSDNESVQYVSSIDAIISWNPVVLKLIETNHYQIPGWEIYGFLPDSFGLNESFPPQDGNGLYSLRSPLDNPFLISPEGVLIATFYFQTINSGLGKIDIPHRFRVPDYPKAKTKIYDGNDPNLIVTGKLRSALVSVGKGWCTGHEIIGWVRCREGFQFIVDLLRGMPGDEYTVRTELEVVTGTIDVYGNASVYINGKKRDRIYVDWACGTSKSINNSCDHEK